MTHQKIPTIHPMLPTIGNDKSSMRNAIQALEKRIIHLEVVYDDIMKTDTNIGSETENKFSELENLIGQQRLEIAELKGMIKAILHNAQ